MMRGFCALQLGLEGRVCQQIKAACLCCCRGPTHRVHYPSDSCRHGAVPFSKDHRAYDIWFEYIFYENPFQDIKICMQITMYSN